MKTSACRDGTFKNQPNKMGTTPQHIHTVPTAVLAMNNLILAKWRISTKLNIRLLENH